MALTDITLTLPAGVTAAAPPVKELDTANRPTGRYRFAIVADRPGTHTVKTAVAGADGQPIERQASALWTFAATDRVGLTVTPASHPVTTAAAAGVQAMVTVTAVGGAAVTDLTAADLVLTSAPAGVQIQPGSFQNHGDGAYSYVVYAAKAGSYTLTAAHGSVSATAAVTFVTPGPTSDATVTWAITPETVQLPNTATARLTVKDDFQNPVTGLTAADIAVGQIPAGVTVTGPVEQTGADGPTGVYVYTLSATAPGRHAVTATLKDAAGGDLTVSDDVEFVFGDLGAVTLALSAVTHPVGAEAAAGVTATVTVTNNQGTPVDNLTAADLAVASAPAGVGVKTGSFANLGGGDYSVLVYATVAGDYTLTASVRGLQDEAAIGFTAGPANAGQTGWTITPDQVTAPGQAVGALTVRDQFGNPVAGLTAADIAVAANPAAPALAIAAQGESAAEPGLYTFALSSSTADVYDVEARVASVVKTARVVFGPGGVDAAASSVTAAPASQRAGQAVEVTVTVRDAHGNPIRDLEAADFTVRAAPSAADSPSPAVQGASFLDRGAGVYTFALTSKAADRFEVVATVKGTALTDRPTVDFTAAGVCVANCETTDPARRTRVVMEANDQPNDGQAKDTARVYVFDTYGNPASGATATAVRSDAALTPERQQITTAADGTGLFEWTSTAVGTFTATVEIDGLAGFDGAVLNQIRFVTTGVSASQSELTVTAPAGLTAPLAAGQSYAAAVTVRDAQRQPLAGVAVSFETSDPAAQLSEPFCLSGADGVCSVTVSSRLAGTYQLTATVPVGGAKQAVAGSPADLGFTAGPVCVTGCTPVDPSHVTGVRVLKNGQPADGQSADEAVVSSYDSFGNPVAATVWSTTPGPGLTATPAVGVTDADGQALISYTSLVSGAHQAVVAIAGEAAPTSPITLAFAAGAAAGVTLTVTPTTPVLVGESFRLTATAADRGGAAVAGVAVDFTAEAPAEFANGNTSCVTDGYGSCSVEVTSKLAGTYEVGGAYAGGALDGAPRQVVFRPDQVCVTGCTPVDPTHVTQVRLIKNGANFNGADRDVAEVVAFDRFGNPAPGAAVTSATADPALSVQPDIRPTGADGTTTIWYTSMAEGAHTATVAVDGEAPAGSPLTLLFGAGTGDPARSVFAIAPKTAGLTAPLTAGAGADNTYVVTATVKDVAGAPAAGDTVTFAVSPAGPVWAGGRLACQTDAAGVCAVELHSTKAGSFTLAAQLPAGLIGSAQPVAWAADAVCGAGCTPEPGVTDITRVEVEVDGQTADGATLDIARVFAFDRWGNPAPNALVTSVPAAGADGLRVQQGIVPTDP
ncbi:MAG: Ig-like domain-containing protein, partial [Propionibacteriaceae bacterium]|nr:Ig-like domain-containing protein [Propionibacteriaceae bacterium]